jgi:hypothetical protein
MKKQSVVKQVLNVLNTQGGKKPKELIAITKAKPASVYNALNQLRSRKMIAKEEDGVYISQTQTSTTPVSKPTNKPIKDSYTIGLERDLFNWIDSYRKLESDYTQAKVMYLNSQAVISYLEEKVAQLIRGN